MMAISQIICVGSDVQNVLTVTSENTEEIIKEIFYKTWRIYFDVVHWCDRMSCGVTNRKVRKKMPFDAQSPEKSV